MERACWICAVNKDVARLCRVERTEHGRIRVQVEAESRNTWETHEHGRPSPRAGKNGHSYASQGHEDETMLTRFAADVGAWLDDHTRAAAIERITLFAPPRLLGAMRQAWQRRMDLHVQERRADLAHLSADRLSHHRAVIGVADRECPASSSP